MKVHVIADTHFNFRSMIFFGKRPFKCLQDMHRQIIRNWNKVVSKKDIVLILGDFGKGNRAFFRWIFQELNGKKVLIKGNHDYKFRIRRMLSIYPLLVFNELLVKIDGINLYLTHKPIKENERNFHINIHGHHHRKYRPSSLTEDYYYNVAIEHINYQPKELITIIKKKGFDIRKEILNESIKNTLSKNNRLTLSF